ncbi:cyclic GMP-AMP synthase-like receptor 2 [Mytilus galloprovincialis]|uniref:cyclic GMP-AMP synthase-like receptor 2 n=1 Tax=Mytilus galloprovincialis TaxID=29158 RepID=UPI003F7C560A
MTSNVRDNITNVKDSVVITSGSFGEGIEMEGSDLDIMLRFIEDLYSVIHGPCITDRKGIMDFAFCLHNKSWVNPANQWVTRPTNSWPAAEVKRDIIDHGVLFVPIGVKGSNNEEIEWRLSFSVGEKLLIYTFSHTQLLCYVLLKILLKDVINIYSKALLCSYFLKTIIFWVSEELQPSVWTPEHLIPCFMKCFRRLIYCVNYSVCPHYFIPENNLFENKIEGIEQQVFTQCNTYLYYSPKRKTTATKCKGASTTTST